MSVMSVSENRGRALSLDKPKSLIKEKEENKYSWDEVHKHRSAEDCWMVIEGKVYDVTPWVNKHPGGQLIMNGAGRDATPLFISYHPLHVQTLLPKYRIGVIEDYQPYYQWQTDFYVTLKRRVEGVVKQHNLRSDSSEMFLKSFLLMIVWSISYYYAFTTGTILSSLILGFAHGHIGIQIAHDGNHGSYSKRTWLAKLAAASMDLMGASSLNWEMQHNVGHHPNSNRKGDFYDEDYDPDAKSGHPFVRMSPNHEWRPMHQYQHIYVWPLFSVVGLKWLYGDFKALALRRYQSFAYWHITLSYVMWSLMTKAFFFYYTFIVFAQSYGIWQGWWMFYSFLAAQSYVFILLFGVNHLTEDCEFPHEKSIERDWAKLQILTSSNFAIGSRIWLWLSGGLNHQIEHHLFPYICHTYLPYVAPIVKQTCKEFNVPYNEFPTYWDALRSYATHIKNLGTQVDKKKR